MKRLDDATLSKLHNLELVAMDEIDRVCRDNGITYFLDSGTLLGAIRHKGFIPWDDDVDIGMMREDYDRFISIAPSYFDSDKYFLQTHESEPAYTNFHAKVRIENTLYPQKGSMKYTHRGIMIDIFPFDYLPDNYDDAVKYLHKVRRIRRLNNTRFREKSIKGVLGHIKHYAAKLLPKSFCRYLFETACKKYNDTKYVTCFSYRMARTQDILFATEDIIPVKKIIFEDREYFQVNNPDAFLREMYGDYWKIPPAKDCYCHVEEDIVFEMS